MMCGGIGVVMCVRCYYCAVVQCYMVCCEYCDVVFISVAEKWPIVKY